MNSNLRIVLLSLVSITCAISAYSQRSSFNADWLFAKAEQEGAGQAQFDDSQWRQVDLPHDWAIEGPFDVKYNARCGGLPFHGTGWYRKHFKVPAAEKGRRLTILFDGAMYNAHVWVNGEFVGQHPYGYTGFFFDITDQVNFGGENVIAVRLTPEDLSSRWYPGAGIYRNVWIEYDNPVHIPVWGTYLTTPEISDREALVELKTDIVNTGGTAVYVVLKTVIKDPSGKAVSEEQKTCLAKPGSQNNCRQFLTVANPELWDVDHPALYEALTQVIISNKVVDEYSTPFGIRTIEYSAAKGFLLNGEYMKLNGVCMHHDQGPLGAAVNRRATERQLQIMKSMGVNAIRTSHNPPSPELLEFCDKLGLVVQVEAFDCWQMAKVPNGYNKFFDDWYDHDLRSMIRRDRNHPSVVMWSIGNEILEQGDKVNGWKLAKILSEICHVEDPTRPTCAGFNNYPGAVVNGLAAQVDIVGLNYRPLNYAEVMKEHPDWIIMGSETSSCTSSRGVYHLPIEKYKTHESNQVSSYDLIGPGWAYPPDIEFRAQDKYPNVLGEFIWTGFDYLGEPTPYGGKDNSTNGYWNADWPSRSSYFAPVDLCGFPKDRYYLYQSQWTKKPMVHVLPHWNWPGMEGKEIPVYAYTNCEEVELFLNGKSLGKKVKGKDTTPLIIDFNQWNEGIYQSPYRLSWSVPYQPGTLKVVGYIGGKSVSEKSVNTAGKPAKISISADRSRITADGADLSFITVRIEDKNGNLCPVADNLVNFDVKGSGSLAAVGNGNAATTESFQAPFRKAFSGMCLLIVRSSDGEAGEISINASSKGLKSTSTKISTNLSPE